MIPQPSRSAPLPEREAAAGPAADAVPAGVRIGPASSGRGSRSFLSRVRTDAAAGPPKRLTISPGSAERSYNSPAPNRISFVRLWFLVRTAR